MLKSKINLCQICGGFSLNGMLEEGNFTLEENYAATVIKDERLVPIAKRKETIFN